MCTEKQLLDCLIGSEVKEGKDGPLGLLFGGRLQPFESSADARYSSEADQANLMTDEVSSWFITLFRIFLPSMISKIDTVPSSKPQQ